MSTPAATGVVIIVIPPGPAPWWEVYVLWGCVAIFGVPLVVQVLAEIADWLRRRR